MCWIKELRNPFVSDRWQTFWHESQIPQQWNFDNFKRLKARRWHYFRRQRVPIINISMKKRIFKIICTGNFRLYFILVLTSSLSYSNNIKIMMAIDIAVTKYNLIHNIKKIQLISTPIFLKFSIKFQFITNSLYHIIYAFLINFMLVTFLWITWTNFQSILSRWFLRANILFYTILHISEFFYIYYKCFCIWAITRTSDS